MKIVLGEKPKAFKPFPVSFAHPAGGEGVITVTFKYRTRKEFGAFLNAAFADAGEEPPVDGKPDWEALYQKIGNKSADHLLEAIEAWDLGFELNRSSMEQLADELPAATVALMSAYNAACTEGRLGNL